MSNHRPFSFRPFTRHPGPVPGSPAIRSQAVVAGDPGIASQTGMTPNPQLRRNYNKQAPWDLTGVTISYRPCTHNMQA